MLLITSAIYSAWAKCRSRQLDAWAQIWANEDFLWAAPGAGAHDGLYDVAIHLEHAMAKGHVAAGGSTDLEKCFGGIRKETTTPIAIIAGFQIKILQAYMHSSTSLPSTTTMRWAYGGQGECQSPSRKGPFSLRPLALIIAPWSQLMRIQGAIPRALVDDLTTIASGDNACNINISALLSTFEYIHASGGKVRTAKT